MGHIDSQITIRDIYEAYRKLKSYFYYDNTSLTIRYKIAEFEQQFYGDRLLPFEKEFSNAMSNVLAIVNGDDKDGKLIKGLLKQISFTFITKSVERPDKRNEGDRLVINRPLDTDIRVSKLNMLIDAPVEIHVISMLWLIFVGKHFRKLLRKNNYAYIFDYDEEEDDLHTGLQLFKPYYIGYQEWRDTALNTASWLMEQGKDASILCLDIQRYYYSARVNVMSLLRHLNEKHGIGIDMEDICINRLSQLVQAINQHYTQITASFVEGEMRVSKVELKNGYTILPVGLLSSAVLGNLYLCDFDDDIVNNLSPAYYGRYVDDMLFVFSERKIEKENVIAKFMKSFEEKGLLKLVNGFYELTGYYNTLKVQEEKVVLQHFFHEESRAAINKFRQNIDKQRSEFRYLPDEDVIDEEFDSDAFSLQYSDSIQKLRSLQGFKEDKFGASKFLASKIFMAGVVKKKIGTKESRKKTSQQILNFFKWRVSIDFCTLWEKVATYFFVTDDPQSLKQFIKQTTDAIDSIQAKDIPDEWIEKYKNDLKEVLLLAVATPYALNPEFKVSGFAPELNAKCKQMALFLRLANMIRHNLLGIPGINYTLTLKNTSANLFDRTTAIGKPEHRVLPYLAPRYFRYDEANMLAIGINVSNDLVEDAVKFQQSITNETNELFRTINYEWYKLYREVNVLPEPTPQPMIGKDNCWNVDIDDNIWEGEVNKRIGIANLKVSDKQVERSMLRKPVLSAERRNTLFAIINQAAKEKCDMLVLPELSVPHQWLDLLVSQSKRHNMATIAGLEYYHGQNGFVYNCVATILPFRMKHVVAAAVNLRIKNHYSPLEKKLLEGYRYKIPSFKKSLYCLFHWRKVYFSVYNCFELANINDRSLFKSKVDLLVATELNRDVNYYADIAGSWVRDIHCYFVQVNTSHYGDSCIMRPTKTETSKMVTVKGGKNSTILVDDLEIDKLRSFQLKEHITQMDDKSFKLTPPDFSRENVQRRIENEPLINFFDN